MIFGEIVEPTTRALIDDDYEEYPEYIEPTVVWEGLPNTCPTDLETIIFIETDKINKLFKALLNETEPMATLNNGIVNIFKEPNNTYIISFVKKELTTGQVIENLSEWIIKAKHIYAITSESTAAYQNVELKEKPETLVRMLSTNPEQWSYLKLESPNLISGLGADILSYCVHNTGLQCTLFIVYMDNSPLDSINTEGIFNLMKSLKLELKPKHLNLNPPSSNLYL